LSTVAELNNTIKFGGHIWRVLDVQYDRVLVITDEILELRGFHNELEYELELIPTFRNEYDDNGIFTGRFYFPFPPLERRHMKSGVTWETSDIRHWLNNDFYNTLSASDRAAIEEIYVINNDNPWFGTPGGNNTTDKLFLLSLEEVVRYFGGNIECLNNRGLNEWGMWEDNIWNEFNVARSARYQEDNSHAWYLRSPGASPARVAAVVFGGSIWMAGVNADEGGRPSSRTIFSDTEYEQHWFPYYGVRPAMWINLAYADFTLPELLPLPTPQVIVNKEFGGHNWRVLDVQNGRALLITEGVIGTRRYHYSWVGVTWENSEIRRWLNNDFYNTFTADYRAKIAETLVINNDAHWSWNNRSAGNDTTDRIFLLSPAEVVHYFGDSGFFAAGKWISPTGWHNVINDQYNNSRIAFNANGLATSWWLRGHGYASAPDVITNGRIRPGGPDVDRQNGIRPAMWIYVDYETEAMLYNALHPQINELRFVLNSYAYNKNGINHESDTAPFLNITYGRTMVPLRVIAEAMGAEVGWDYDTRTVTITGRGEPFSLVIDEPLPSGMGTAVIISNRTFVPVRYIAEMLGAVVEWCGISNAVYIRF